MNRADAWIPTDHPDTTDLTRPFLFPPPLPQFVMPLPIMLWCAIVVELGLSIEYGASALRDTRGEHAAEHAARCPAWAAIAASFG